MTQNDASAVLHAAFAALPGEQRARLRRHAERGTPILCGAMHKSALNFGYVWQGRSCPAVLAVTDEDLPECALMSPESNAAVAALRSMCSGHADYLRALAATDEATVRAAMRECGGQAP